MESGYKMELHRPVFWLYNADVSQFRNPDLPSSRARGRYSTAWSWGRDRGCMIKKKKKKTFVPIVAGISR
jgi:hypothetical protein